MNKVRNTIICTIVVLLVSACGKQKLPKPAITFQNTLQELTDKETNKYLSLKDNLDKPGTLGCIYNLTTSKFLTETKDTIIYHFAGNHLLSVLIVLNKVDYAKTIKHFKNDKELQDKGNNMFEDKNKTIIRIGQQDGNNATSLLYLNNESNEIGEMVKALGNSTDNILQKQDNDKFFVQTLLYLIGTSDVVNSMPMFFMQQSNYYYNKVLKEAAHPSNP